MKLIFDLETIDPEDIEELMHFAKNYEFTLSQSDELGMYLSIKKLKDEGHDEVS